MKVLLDVNLPKALHTPLTAVSRNRTVLIRNLLSTFTKVDGNSVAFDRIT